MADTPKSDNITWHHGHVCRALRAKSFGQRGVTLWLTGLSGSGKSTLARAVELALIELGVFCAVLDGDNVRHGLNSDLGFSPEDRTENIRRVGEVAKLFTEAEVIVITAFISPYQTDRDRARALLSEGDFAEVFVDCTLEACETRDPKGLYARARAGEIASFTGISAPYEVPAAPELVVNTAEMTLEESVTAVLDYLRRHGHISTRNDTE